MEFGVLVFVEGGRPEYPEKNPLRRDENQQQTQPTCDAGSQDRTLTTVVGGERSHHYTITPPRTLVTLVAYGLSVPGNCP